MLRLFPFIFGLLCLGCQVIVPTHFPEAGERRGVSATWTDSSRTTSKRPFEEVVLASSDLVRVVECLEKGDDATACVHLARHIAAHPDHLSLRAQYAELLFNQERWLEAREEFDRFAAVAQERGAGLLPLLIHAHSRLMELAEMREDDYQVHLQRGIGLYCLAQKQAQDEEEELSVEGLLFKAASELSQAHQLQPGQARPCWYLYSTWRGLAQRQSAQRWLKDTSDRAADSFLTLGEQRRLHLACQAMER